MRRSSVFVLVLAGALCAPAVAARAAETTKASVTIDTSGSVVATPGQRSTITLTLHNADTVERTVRLEAAGTESAIRSWVTIADTVVTIAPAGDRAVEVRVDVPGEATPSTHTVEITASVEGAGTPIGAASVPLQVAGEPKGALTIESVLPDTQTNGLVLTVRNDGGIPVHASGELTIANTKTRPFEIDVRPQTKVALPLDGGATSATAARSVTVVLRYGPDTARWSGTVRPTAEPAAADDRPAPQDPTVDVVAPRQSSLPVLWIVLIAIPVLAALAWLIAELLAVRRAPGHQPVHQAGHQPPLPIGSLEGQLAPLVAAIEQLARAVTSQLVVPMEEPQRDPEPEPEPESKQEPSTQRATEPCANQDEVQAVAGEDEYFQDEAYQRVSHEGVESLSRIEAAANAVKETYGRVDFQAEIDDAIEATIVADDALRRAELIEAVASGLGIPKAILLEWMPDDVFDRTTVEGTPADLAQLRRDNRVLELQVAILKRAVAHFARA